MGKITFILVLDEIFHPLIVIGFEPFQANIEGVVECFKVNLLLTLRVIKGIIACHNFVYTNFKLGYTWILQWNVLPKLQHLIFRAEVYSARLISKDSFWQEWTH